jgi:REP element-mobilizing transposase RayT
MAAAERSACGQDTDIPYLADMEYLKGVTNHFQPLLTETFYHIYNRGNNGENLFYRSENYRYFLRKFDHYVSPYLYVYAYCLLPNHFHFLIKTKSHSSIPQDAKRLLKGNQALEDFSAILSEEFRRLFLSYAKAIKIQEGRTGSLFEKNFKRKMISDDKHFLWVINYIHRNAETHRMINDFRTYPHSSYQSLLSCLPTKLMRQEVFDLLGGREKFIRFHQTNPIIKNGSLLVFE